jgi:hypothetical protein
MNYFVRLSTWLVATTVSDPLTLLTIVGRRFRTLAHSRFMMLILTVHQHHHYHRELV